MPELYSNITKNKNHKSILSPRKLRNLFLFLTVSFSAGYQHTSAQMLTAPGSGGTRAQQVGPRLSGSVTSTDNAPSFNLGHVQSYSACINSTANSINSHLQIDDLDIGQTETWTVLSGPAHGALGGFSYSGTSTGGVVTPVGLTYTPTAGYSGADEFTIQISDGTLTDTTHVNVTVDPLATVGATSGAANLCTGSISAYTNTVSGGNWTSSNTAVATAGAASGIVTGVSAGTALISYTVTGCGSATATKTVIVANGAAINTITGTTTECTGSSTTLDDLTGGGSWSSFNTAVATIGSSSGSYTGIAAGTSLIIYTASISCGAATATTTVTINTVPNAGTISGVTSICTGTISTLTETVGTGVWSSSNAAVVSIGSSSGAATGVSVGTAVVSYAVTNACGTSYATSNVVVNTAASAGSITGVPALCTGSFTTFTDGVPGGTWTSSNTALATIGSASGLITGVSAGSVIVTYSVTNSCGTAIATAPVTVISSTATLGPITGITSICEEAGTTLSNDTTGGTWSSSNTSVATVGSSTGIVHGVLPGTATIVYSANVTCGVASASTVVTVLELPDAGTITGVARLCSGSFNIYTDNAAGGVWNSSNSAVASVGSLTGLVSGVAPGTAIVSYSVTNTCGTAIANSVITIGTAGTVGAITGTTAICPGEAVTLSDTTAGGTWESLNTGIATAGSTGTITGVATGSTQIVYTATQGCGAATATTTVTVNPAPSLISTLDPPGVCSGSLFSYVPVSSYSGATFTWYRPTTPGISNPSNGGTGDIAETLDNSTSADIPVTYYYTVMALGCTSHQDVTVTIRPIPRLSSATADTVCSGGDLSYTPASLTTGVTYTWSRSAVSGIAPATGTGSGAINEVLVNSTSAPIEVVYLYALTAGGCTSSRDLDVLVTPAPVSPTITTQSPSTVCSNTLFQNFGASVALGSGYSYTWSAINADIWDMGSTGQYCLVNFNNPGNALVILKTAISGINCVVNDTVTVNVGTSVSTSAPVIYFDEQFAYMDNNTDTYQWGYDNLSTLDSTLIPGATYQTYPDSNPDFIDNAYWVITTYNGCMEKTYYNNPLSVQNINSSAVSMKVYPDPATSILNIELQNNQGGKTTVDIINVMGQKVSSLTTTGNTLVVDVAQLPAGYYFVNCLQNGTKLTTGRFIRN